MDLDSLRNSAVTKREQAHRGGRVRRGDSWTPREEAWQGSALEAGDLRTGSVRLFGPRGDFGVTKMHSSQEVKSWRWWREAVPTRRRATGP